MRSSKIDHFLFAITKVIYLWIFVNVGNVAAQYRDPNVCGDEKCVRAANWLNTIMDTSNEACDDFYSLMCGGFMKENPVSGAFMGINNISERKTNLLRMTIEFLMKKNDGAGEATQKARDYFRSCMDEDTIDKYGLDSLTGELQRIGLKLKSPFTTNLPQKPISFARLVGKMHREAVKTSFLFNAKLFNDVNDKERNYLIIENTPVVEQKVRNVPFGQAEGNSFPIRIVRNSPAFKTAPNLMAEYITKAVLYIDEAATGIPPSESTIAQVVERAQGVTNFILSLQAVLQNREQNLSPPGVLLGNLRDDFDTLLQDSLVKFDWITYINTLLDGIVKLSVEEIENYEVLIGNQRQLQQVFSVIAQTPPDIFLSAAWWVTVHSVIPTATKDLQNMRQQYELQVFGKQPSPRNVQYSIIVGTSKKIARSCTFGWNCAVRQGAAGGNAPYDEENKGSSILAAITGDAAHVFCAQETIAIFGEVIAHHLINVQNGVEEKNKVIEMSQNIIFAFEDQVRRNSWLDNYTKSNIITKLNNISGIIGFVDGLEDPKVLDKLYEEVPVWPDHFYETTMSKLRSNRNYMLRALFTKNSESDFDQHFMNPAEMLARYRVDRNEIEVSIAHIGYPYYDLGIEALNYGIMGFILAHEMSHSQGTDSRLFDENGDQKLTWNITALQKFEEISKCFVRAYSPFFVHDEYGQRVPLDAQRTLDENMADNNGFQLALMAYDRYEAKHGQEKKLIGFERFSHQKLLTMAFAALWCESTTPRFRVMQMTTDVHSPGPFRVYGVVQNSEAFSTIWGCSPNDPMNPPDKCKLF